MATVRIYKVAELLGSTSQEVLALLKRDHGIELKSASSTIEEVVARSFVERVAKQRSISLPGGFRYLVRVRFTPEKVDREHREDFLRSITLYEGRNRPGADCTGSACWFAVRGV